MIHVVSLNIEDGLVVLMCTDSQYDVRDNGRSGRPVQRVVQFSVERSNPRYKGEIEEMLDQLQNLVESVYSDFDRAQPWEPEDEDDDEGDNDSQKVDESSSSPVG